jgi:hypothetical protein
MSNDTVKKFECVFDYTVEHFKSGEPLNHTSRLWFCDEDFAPKFRNHSGIFKFSVCSYAAVSQLCEVEVNHRDLPIAAFKQRNGFNGIYYQVAYELQLTFGSELIFKMAYQGTIHGSVRAHYV